MKYHQQQRAKSVAQLPERLLLTPDDIGSHPVIGNYLLTFYLIEVTKIKKHRQGMTQKMITNILVKEAIRLEQFCQILIY